MSRQIPQDSTDESVGKTVGGTLTLAVGVVVVLAVGVTKSITVGNRVLGVKGTKTESDDDISNGLVWIQSLRQSVRKKTKCVSLSGCVRLDRAVKKI